MPKKILQNLLTNLLEFVKSDERNTGPTIREKNDNLTVSYNIYNNLSINWSEIKKIVETILEAKDLTPLGEVITYNGTGGKIIDQGNFSFEVLRSKIWECYFYEPETFFYVRLLWEQDNQQKTTKNWLSLDIDLVDNSAWFSEKSRKEI
jgi:hypothetical protein